jgi:hypothetical protein
VIAGKRLKGFAETPLQKNIFLLNNTFTAISGPALALSGVDGLVAEGNTFTSGSPTGPLVTVQYSEDIVLTNNAGQDRAEFN